jgi:hypothetical protein
MCRKRPLACATTIGDGTGYDEELRYGLAMACTRCVFGLVCEGRTDHEWEQHLTETQLRGEASMPFATQKSLTRGIRSGHAHAQLPGPHSPCTQLTRPAGNAVRAFINACHVSFATTYCSQKTTRPESTMPTPSQGTGQRPAKLRRRVGHCHLAVSGSRRQLRRGE